MTLVRGVVDRFLRRSGSRESILNAWRREVPTVHSASVKSLFPLGQPKKALGHEPQIDLCVANQATPRLASLRERSKSSLPVNMHGRNEARKSKARTSRTGARRQGNLFSFQSREKNVLDISSYRS